MQTTQPVADLQKQDRIFIVVFHSAHLSSFSNRDKKIDTNCLQERCEKPTPLGVGWIALLIYTLLCIFLFFIHILCYTTTMENKYRHMYIRTQRALAVGVSDST